MGCRFLDDGGHLPVEGGDLLGEGGDPAGEADQGCGGGVLGFVESGWVVGQCSGRLTSLAALTLVRWARRGSGAAATRPRI